MLKTTSLLVLLVSFQIGYSQLTLVLQPDSLTGKDSDIYSIEPNMNYGNTNRLVPYAWMHSGIQNTVRSLIEFDLSNLPTGAIISNAQLSLSYNPHYPTPLNVHKQFSRLLLTLKVFRILT